MGFCIAGRRDELFMRLREEGMGIENFVPMRYRIVERRRETNTNLTDGTNMRELRRETNTNLTDKTDIRNDGTAEGVGAGD